MAHPSHRDAALLDRRVGEARERAGRLGYVLAGQDRHDARKSRGGADIDREDARMSVRAPEHGGMQHIGQVDIVDVASLPGEQARIFHALDAFAYPFQLLAGPFTLPAGWNGRALLDRGHHAASSWARSSSAARSTDAMMF